MAGVLISTSADSQSPEIKTLIQDAKNLEASAKEEEALEKFLQVLKIDPENFEATWKASFLYSKTGNRESDFEKKKQSFLKAKQYAEKALQLSPKDAESNYVMAVAMGRMAMISSPKEKVAASRDIKKYTELAILYNPNHARAYHVLGKWNYEAANLNFAERGAANLLFGGIPQGTLEEAIKNYLKAITLSPNEILFYLDLAYALEKKELKDEEMRVLKQALLLKPRTQDDPRYLKECKAMLDN